MNKELIKKYALNLTSEDILSYSKKENLNISNEEADLFIRVIHSHSDELLNGNALDILDNYKIEGYSDL